MTASKNMKYLGINLIKYVKTLYTGNHKMLPRQIKEGLRFTFFIDQRTRQCEDTTCPQIEL